MGSIEKSGEEKAEGKQVTQVILHRSGLDKNSGITATSFEKMPVGTMFLLPGKGDRVAIKVDCWERGNRISDRAVLLESGEEIAGDVLFRPIGAHPYFSVVEQFIGAWSLVPQVEATNEVKWKKGENG